MSLSVSHGNVALFIVLSPVEQVEHHQDLSLGHTLRCLVKPIKAWVDHVNKGVISITMLEASIHPVLVHPHNKCFELFAVQQTILIRITRGKCLLDFLHKRCKFLWIIFEFLLEDGSGLFLLVGELGLPLLLIGNQGCQKGLDSLLLFSGGLQGLINVSVDHFWFFSVN